MSLQADGKVAFEDIPVFGVCRPACHDSSLYLFVLVLFFDAVALYRVDLYAAYIPCSCNDVNIAWVCTESNAFS